MSGGWRTEEKFDAIVLGAGAAGMFCAALAGERGRRVLLVDHAPRAGRKILISGGGRSNFTNLHTRPENFLSENSHFAKSALARYTPQEFVELVERYGIAYHEKAPGQLFCDGSAKQIVDMLLDLCVKGGVVVELGTEVRGVEFSGGEYCLMLTGAGTGAGSGSGAESGLDSDLASGLGSGADAKTRVVRAPAVVVATGGLSIPKLGATGFGYELARQFGLRVVEPRPALVPLTFGGEDRERFEGLSGVATEVSVGLGANGVCGTAMRAAGAAGGGVSFRDRMLITHRGLSGPAILQISSYWRAGMELTLDLAPGRVVTAPLLEAGARRDAGAAANAWQAVLPRRLAERLLAIAPPESFRTAALEAAERALHGWVFRPAGTEGYEKAEVTAGGVATEELSAKTMEVRRQAGLFFIGEVVDVTGHLGGYNFQWAWASGAAAARAV